MPRRPFNAPDKRDNRPRANAGITAPTVRVIGSQGQNHGVMSPAEALKLATDEGLDLVEISPTASPPVCKITDFGKYKYALQKRESETRRKQKVIDVKEVKFRPNTDTHDYETKIKSITRFLGNGDKVKITMRFRGREMAHQELGHDLLQRVAEDMNESGKVEAMPKMDGRQMSMVIAPVK